MNQRGLFARRGLLLAAAFVLLFGASALLAEDDAFVPGGEGDGPSIDAAVSAGGRYVAFASEATNLVSNDRNELQDIFVHDRQTGDTARVSLGPDGAEPDGFSEWPAISSDGRYVVFTSSATNLVPFDTNMEPDVFVHDRETGETTRASVTSGGAQASGASYEPAVSSDGRYVVFTSSATNLDPADADPAFDVYLHDRQTGATELISFDADGTYGVGYTSAPAVSADGRTVAFTTFAADVVAHDNNDVEDVFVRDRQTKKTTRVSVRSDGDEVFAESYEPSLSADGRYVAFWSYANELTDDGAGWWNVFLHDRQTGETTLISRGAGGAGADGGSSRPRLSADGRTVVFESEATNLTAGPDDNFASDVFLHDRQTGDTSLMSVGAAGSGDGDSLRPAISPDGGFVAFHSDAPDLVPDDDNGTTDVFLRDRAAGTTARVSLAAEEAEPLGEAVFMAFVTR